RALLLEVSPVALEVELSVSGLTLGEPLGDIPQDEHLLNTEAGDDAVQLGHGCALHVGRGCHFLAFPFVGLGFGFASASVIPSSASKASSPRDMTARMALACETSIPGDESRSAMRSSRGSQEAGKRTAV